MIYSEIPDTNRISCFLNACVISLFTVFALVIPAKAGTLDDGLAAYKSGDYATAMKIFPDLAAQGNAEAQNKLGGMYSK